jgi:hypothetical protein
VDAGDSLPMVNAKIHRIKEVYQMRVWIIPFAHVAQSA